MWHDPIASEFANALLNPSLAKPASVVGPHGKAAGKRFNVYRNNMAYSLVEALGKNYPFVKAECGEARFNDAAILYLREHPPRTKVMFELGKCSEPTTGFADWLDAFAPAKAQMPWLADLARTERAWLDAYHAEDASTLDPALLSTISPEMLGETRFIKHPAAFIICSPFSIFTLIERSRTGQPHNVPVEQQDVLITRPQLEVGIRKLSAGAGVFLAKLFEGANLAEAAQAATEHAADFDLAGALAVLLQSGATNALS